MSHLQASLRERGGERDRYRDIYIYIVQVQGMMSLK